MTLATENEPVFCTTGLVMVTVAVWPAAMVAG